MSTSFIRITLAYFVILSVLLFTSTITEAQSKGGHNSTNSWHSHADELPGSDDTIIWVAVGVVVAGVVAYFIITSSKSEDEDVETDSTTEESTVLDIDDGMSAIINNPTNRYEKTDYLSNVKIIAGIRRNSFDYFGRQVYLGVNVGF